jgi:hypothetical protein
MRSSGVITAFAVLAALAAPAAADTKVTRVGVVIGIAIDVEPAVADSIGGALAAALADKLVVDAIGGVEVTRRLPAGGVPDECVATPACVADLAKRLAADQLLFLGVLKAGAEYHIDVTFVHVATGAQAARPRLRLQYPQDAKDEFAANAVRYLPDAAVRDTGDSTTIIQQNPERHRPIKKSVWIVGGIGAGALIGAGAMGLVAKSRFDDCDKNRPECTPGDRDSLKTLDLAADITLGVGVACAITAVVLYVKTPVETLPVTPSVTPVEGGAVLAFDGRF